VVCRNKITSGVLSLTKNENSWPEHFYVWISFALAVSEGNAGWSWGVVLWLEGRVVDSAQSTIFLELHRPLPSQRSKQARRVASRLPGNLGAIQRWRKILRSWTGKKYVDFMLPRYFQRRKPFH
jgi:hypothetical protein